MNSTVKKLYQKYLPKRCGISDPEALPKVANLPMPRSGTDPKLRGLKGFAAVDSSSKESFVVKHCKDPKPGIAWSSPDPNSGINISSLNSCIQYQFGCGISKMVVHKTFEQKSTYFFLEKNVDECQNGHNFKNRVVQKLKIENNVFTKKRSPKLIFFDIENQL